MAKSKSKTSEKSGKGKRHVPPEKKKQDELLDMSEAIELLKTTRPTFYRWLRSGKIKGMKIGRQWRFYPDDIQQFLEGKPPRVDAPVGFDSLVKDLREYAGKSAKKLKKDGETDDVRMVVRLMMHIGISQRASDIHLTSHYPPGEIESLTSMRLRIDGVLQQAVRIDRRLIPALMEEWKRMAELDVHEKSRPQDGRILIEQTDLGIEGESKVVDLRVCFLPTGLGESLTVRILDPSIVNLELKKLDYAPWDHEKMTDALKSAWGLIICTGPTGSGKTTTLYSCLNEINKPEIRVISVEDPVEYYLPWVTQVDVSKSEGMTFPLAFKAIMRSDPDVILVGEIRDLESVRFVTSAAMTGHLVLTQLHADGAVEALFRLIKSGGDPYHLSNVTRLIVSQRLVRKLCVKCSKKSKKPPAGFKEAVALAEKEGFDEKQSEWRFASSAGCSECAKMGYRGRAVISEALTITPEIEKALLDGAETDEVRKIAIGQGMRTMYADGIRRVSMGETSMDEIRRVIRPHS